MQDGRLDTTNTHQGSELLPPRSVAKSGLSINEDEQRKRDRAARKKENGLRHKSVSSASLGSKQLTLLLTGEAAQEFLDLVQLCDDAIEVLSVHFESDDLSFSMVVGLGVPSTVW